MFEEMGFLLHFLLVDIDFCYEIRPLKTVYLCDTLSSSLKYA